MRIGYEDCARRQIERNCGWSRILRAQRKRRWRGRNDLGGAVWKIAAGAAESPLPEVVKHAGASAQRGSPIGPFTNLPREPDPGCNVSIGGLIERRAARGQGYRRWMIQSGDSKRIVRAILPLDRRINLPSQAIGQRESGMDFPRVLAVEREVMRD